MVQLNNFNANEKILRYPEKLDYFFNGHKTLIVTELDLTNKCNHLCPGCCGVNENKEELSKEQIDQIIKNLSDVDNQGIILSGGGEPLISPHFTYAVNLIRKQGMKIGLNSNGSIMNEEVGTVIAENFEYFRISLDAGSPEIFKLTHGMNEAAFHKTIENIKKFQKIRKSIGSKTSFGVGFLTSVDTACDMEKFVELMVECKVDFAQFRPFTGEGFELYDASEEIIRLQKKYNSPEFKVLASMHKYSNVSEPRTYTKCRGMYFSTVVTADAMMFSCLHYRQHPDYLLGEITPDHTIEDILSSSQMRRVYENIDCSTCPELCRNDVFNRTLETLSLDVTNSEFL
ncbi:MAG: radical SAM protein [Eubacteriales bacterium]